MLVDGIPLSENSEKRGPRKELGLRKQKEEENQKEDV